MPVETGQPRWLSYSFSVSSGPLWFRSTGRDAGRDRTAGWLPYSFSVSSVPLWFRSTGRDSGRNRTAGWLSYSFFVSSVPLWFRSTGRDAGRNRTAKMAVLLILRVLGTSGVQIDRQGCRSKQDSQDGCPTHSPCPRTSAVLIHWSCSMSQRAVRWASNARSKRTSPESV